MRMTLRSRRTNVFLTNVWAPILCILFAMVVGRGYDGFLGRNFFLACPFLVFALFCFSIARVEVRDGVLRYRRLLEWRTIPRDEILEARVEWAPFIGSVRLKKFLFPWGRLYFALDANSNSIPVL